MKEFEAYAVPDRLEAPLAGLRDYWEGLRRGGNDTPFWDDVKLSALPDHGSEMMLIEVFEHPDRFRFNFVGESIVARYGVPIAGKFIDEIEARDPFDHLEAQCAETLRARSPTYFRHHTTGTHGYARLVLPLWGRGRIEMLLAASTAARAVT